MTASPHLYVVSLVVNSPDTIVMKVITLPDSKALVWLNEAKKGSLRKKRELCRIEKNDKSIQSYQLVLDFGYLLTSCIFYDSYMYFYLFGDDKFQTFIWILIFFFLNQQFLTLRNHAPQSTSVVLKTTILESLWNQRFLYFIVLFMYFIAFLLIKGSGHYW